MALGVAGGEEGGWGRGGGGGFVWYVGGFLYTLEGELRRKWMPWWGAGDGNSLGAMACEDFVWDQGLTLWCYSEIEEAAPYCCQSCKEAGVE